MHCAGMCSGVRTARNTIAARTCFDNDAAAIPSHVMALARCVGRVGIGVGVGVGVGLPVRGPRGRTQSRTEPLLGTHHLCLRRRPPPCSNWLVLV